MKSTLRFAAFTAFAVVLGVACSDGGSEAESNPGVPPYQGPVPSTDGTAGNPGPGAPAATPPGGSDTPADGTPEAQGELPLQPSSTPETSGGTPPVEQPAAEQPPAEDPAEQPPAAEPPAEPPPAEEPPPEEPPVVISTDRSTLPLPPGNAGQPEPAGAPGGLTVLNWAGFRSAVSYTFDDTNQTQLDRFNDLMALNVKFSWYLITGPNQAARLANAAWDRAVAAGHEIGNHTRGHLNSGGGNLAQDTDGGEADLEQRFDNLTVYSMAAPFGAQDYVGIAQSRYLINRGTNGGQVAPNGNTNQFSIPTYIPNPDAIAFNAQVDQGRTNGTWHTVLVHGFKVNGNGVNGDFQPVEIGEFTQAVNYAKSFGDVWIDTVVEVGAYWLAQRLFNGVTPATNGNTTTWSWTLPDHFPPGKFLRVRVNGGTLTQDGAELPWNDRGFYEVALDRGSLTLSP